MVEMHVVRTAGEWSRDHTKYTENYTRQRLEFLKRQEGVTPEQAAGYAGGKIKGANRKTAWSSLGVLALSLPVWYKAVPAMVNGFGGMDPLKQTAYTALGVVLGAGITALTLWRPFETGFYRRLVRKEAERKSEKEFGEARAAAAFDQSQRAHAAMISGRN